MKSLLYTRRAVTVGSAALMAGALTLSSPAFAENGVKGKTVEYIAFGLQFEYQVALVNGIKKRAADAGVVLHVIDGKGDPNLQVTQVLDAVTKKPDALLINPVSMTNSDLLVAVRAAATTIGVQVEAFSASTPRDIETAFESMVLKRVDALIVGAGAPFRERQVQLSTLATFHRLPAIYATRGYAQAGGLMSYGPVGGDQFRNAGTYTGLILKGEKPADLPVLRPTKFLFVINLQTARVLGIEVPETLLATADEVIQ